MHNQGAVKSQYRALFDLSADDDAMLKHSLMNYATAWTRSDKPIKLPKGYNGAMIYNGMWHASHSPNTAKRFVLPSRLITESERKKIIKEYYELYG